MGPVIVTVTFVGNMAVHVTDGQASILSDFPYESGYSVPPVPLKWSSASAKSTLKLVRLP